MERKKVYLQPMQMVFDAILEMMELQKGNEIKNDPSYGKIDFKISLYGVIWEFRFTALELDGNRCSVSLKIVETGNAVEDADGDERCLDNMIRREYALLDSLLLIGTPLETKYDKKGDETV